MLNTLRLCSRPIFQESRYFSTKAISAQNPQEKVAKTYSWLTYNIASTTAFGIVSYESGIAEIVAKFATTHHPLVACAAFVAAANIPLIATIFINEESSPKLKKMVLTTYNATLGALLSPLGYLGASALIPAAAFTAGVSGALAATSRMAKDDLHLKFKYPLGIGLGAVTTAALCAVATKGSFQSLAEFVSLYGGLALYSTFLVADVQQVRLEAEEKDFSPVNHSILLHLDILNIGIRCLELLQQQSAKSPENSVEAQIKDEKQNTALSAEAWVDPISEEAANWGSHGGNSGSDGGNWDD